MQEHEKNLHFLLVILTKYKTCEGDPIIVLQRDRNLLLTGLQLKGTVTFSDCDP